MTALEKFNRAFDKNFLEPLPADAVEKLEDYARLRGRHDIALALAVLRTDDRPQVRAVCPWCFFEVGRDGRCHNKKCPRATVQSTINTQPSQSHDDRHYLPA